MPLYGPRWPLKRGNEDTYELYDDVKHQVSFYLKNLLLTHPGENISDPGYGVGIRQFLFEQNVESVRSLIQSRVSGQISRYLPYLSVEDIQVAADSAEIDENTLKLRITYSIPGNFEQQVFDLNLKQTQEIGFY